MTTKVYAVIGHPIGHSLSPAMHNAAFRLLAIDAVFVTFDVRPDLLDEAVRGFRAIGLAGFNVTVPHKEAVGRLCDEVDEDAGAIGAVNCVILEGDRLIGTNTDVPGLVRSLEESSVDVAGGRAVVLGAGGAARAAVLGLVRAGAAEVAVAARREDAAHLVIEDVRVAAPEAILRPILFRPELLRDVFAGASVVIQATPATLNDGPEAIPFAESLPLDACTAECTIVDLVYKPRITTVLQRARDEGLRILDGTGMLLHQGALAFERWTKREAPLQEMRRALLEG